MNQLLFMIHNSMELYENLCQPVCRECGIAQTALDILMFLANNPEYYTAREILVSNIAPSDFETFQRCMDTIRQNIERAKKISAKAKSTEKGDKKR